MTIAITIAITIDITIDVTIDITIDVTIDVTTENYGNIIICHHSHGNGAGEIEYLCEQN